MECWVRYVYPRIKRSGTSQLTDFYGLNGREEARACEHQILRERLIRAFQVLLDSDKPVYEVFSKLGVMKIRTCAPYSSLSDELIFKQLNRLVVYLFGVFGII